MTLEEIKTVTEAAADKTLDKFEELLKSRLGKFPLLGHFLDGVFSEAKNIEHEVIDKVVAELLGNPPVPVTN